MDVAAHRKGAGARKIDFDRLARRLLRRIERHVFRIDIDLVEEFILVGKQNRVAPGDRDVADREGAPFLDDSVHRDSAGKTHDKHEQEKNDGLADTAYQFRRDRTQSLGKQRLGRAHSGSMRLMSPRATWLFGVIALAPMAAAAAEDISVFVNGFVDLGGVVPSHETSWLRGGLGKLDNGGDGRQGPAFVGQGMADLRVKFDPAVSFFATLRLAPDQQAPFDILEAYGRYQPISTQDWLLSIKLGAFFPPISLENESVGWTSPWTLTPSAINSWVGDELRTVGAETNLEWRYQTGALGLTGAAYGFNDPTGTLLADRGWAFDSRPIGLLGEPRRPDFVSRQNGNGLALREEPFKEIDGRPGWYVGGSLRQDELGRLSALYYDNRADPAAHIGSDFGWRTRFASLGLETYLGDVVILSQAMFGNTDIQPFGNFHATTDFQSVYLLAGYYFDEFRIAGRVDLFATQLHRSVGMRGPGENGRAFTLSGSWTPARWLRLSTELLQVDSYRGQRMAAGNNPNASELQVQFVGRIFF